MVVEGERFCMGYNDSETCALTVVVIQISQDSLEESFLFGNQSRLIVCGKVKAGCKNIVEGEAILKRDSCLGTPILE